MHLMQQAAATTQRLHKQLVAQVLAADAGGLVCCSRRAHGLPLQLCCLWWRSGSKGASASSDTWSNNEGDWKRLSLVYEGDMHVQRQQPLAKHCAGQHASS